VNFLPIPIVDGGLFIFLLMEKITGRPPSARVQTAAQVMGLLLLGSLFLFVTYHDVVRMAG
jgi:regulator of sigma E protease